MKPRKKYEPLTAVQKSLAEGSTAILADGTIVKDAMRLSDSGRFWVGTIAEGRIGERADGQAAQFNAESVIDVVSTD